MILVLAAGSLGNSAAARTLTPNGEAPIIRPNGAGVWETSWRIKSLSKDAWAAVMETASCPRDFMAWRLSPAIMVFTNARPDHQDGWA